MGPRVFEFDSYRAFLKSLIASPSSIKGYQSRLAEAAGCQRSYFSQALNGKKDLTTDHAARLSRFLRLTADEAEYFVRLVELERAQAPVLRDLIKARLKNLRTDQENLTKRLRKSEPIATIDNQRYYSSWHYGAIHILVGIASYQTVGAIAMRLQLPSGLVESTLLDLREMGLIETDGQRWRIKDGHFHLPKESALTSTNHTNWRQRAVLDAQQTEKGGLHYTVVCSHSLKDQELIKGIFLEAIDRARALIRDSANEELSAICLDFYRV